MSAALDMLSTKGADSTTIEDITERADVGKGTFYRHFANKDEIITALTDDLFANLIEKLRSRQENSGELAEVLAHLLDTHVVLFSERTGEFLFFFQGRLMRRLQHAVDAELESPFADYLEEIRAQLAPYVSSGPVDLARARRVACALAGCVSALVALTAMDLPREQAEPSLTRVREAFVGSCTDYLKQAPAVAAAVAGGATREQRASPRKAEKGHGTHENAE